MMEPNISAWRRTVLGDLTSAFDFRHPEPQAVPRAAAARRSDEATAIRNAQEELPQVPIPLGGAGTLPMQPAGVRPSRALPYELARRRGRRARRASGSRSATTGDAGAVFHVYDRLRLDAVPRRYTVEPGTALDDVWSAGPGVGGRYDLWVMGPNGFLRHVTGATDTG